MNTVLITGANRGIGLELAKQYAAEDWHIHACCRTPDNADDLAALAAGAGRRVSVHPLEVTSDASVQALRDRLADARLDILINNAGISGPSNQSFQDMDFAGWMGALEVNVLAPLRVSQALAGHLTGDGRKVIATISSRMGSIGDTTSSDRIAYRTSKTAVNQVVNCMANELRAQQIICLALHPGWVRTDMGGPSAPVSPPESAAGLRRVIGSVAIQNSGRFLNYDGREIPW